MYFGGPFFSYKEIFDRVPTLKEAEGILAQLDPVETAVLLCQMSADVRLSKRKREEFGKMQRELAGGLFDDETIERLKKRFARVHCGDRPVFHSAQILNVLRLAIRHCAGPGKPHSEEASRYKVGTACLMLSDLLLTEEEKVAITTGDEDSRRRALMTQMLGPFEIVNTQAITHLIYRSRIMFRILLRDSRIIARIKRDCDGFDFEREFLALTNISLTTWLFLIFLAYAYLMNYLGEDGNRNHQYLGIDRSVFRGDSKITQVELDAFLGTMSLNLAAFRGLIGAKRNVDWRFDFTPFKGKPLVELHPNKFFCSDLGFLVEKMHGGVYWTLFDGLDRKRRPCLFQAWGLLFEEYVNWFLSNRKYCTPVRFYPAPKWSDGSESFDGAFLQDSRFMPMEYKGKVLKMEARYSGDPNAFESDLDLKIVQGCQQLARKIEALFNGDPSKRRRLPDVPLDHVTRIVPVLVVQDHILRGPLVNWRLNQKFNEILDRAALSYGVTVDSLNVIGIYELETMAESAEGGTFDIFHGLQLRCFKDPQMTSDLHSFLMAATEYGQGKSERIEKILQEQWEELAEYSFGEGTLLTDNK